MTETWGGIILCGGQSTRMGRPKWSLPIDGRTMLEQVVDRLRAAVSEVVVVAGPEQDLPALPTDVRLARDAVAYQGPLLGLANGLEALSANAAGGFVCAVDSPLLNLDCVRRVVSMIDGQPIDLVMLKDGEFFHPLHSVYRKCVADTARRLIAAGRHRPIALFDHHVHRTLAVGDLRDLDPPLDTLLNLNTPADYDAFLQRLDPRR